MTPAGQLAGFLAKYDPEIATLARSARSRLRKRMPSAVELVYDNYNALAIAFSATEKLADAIVSLTLYPKWVSLFFVHGTDLPDPDERLRGSGTRIRHVVLASAADVDAAPIAALLRAAIRAAKTPLPRGKRGSTVIASISARQRPRRPTAPR